MLIFQVSKLAEEIQKGVNGDPNNAIIGRIESPFLAVAGGEMYKSNGYFYLIFGQNYGQVYDQYHTGDYTSAIKSFRISNGNLADTSSAQQPFMHRRDLNVELTLQTDNNFLVAYGGVFTADGDGYTQPVQIWPAPGNIECVVDTLNQITSQYACAMASVYDINSNTNTHIFFGGIGQNMYVYDERNHYWKWENGDNGKQLPFVKSITQMTWQNGILRQAA